MAKLETTRNTMILVVGLTAMGCDTAPSDDAAAGADALGSSEVAAPSDTNAGLGDESNQDVAAPASAVEAPTTSEESAPDQEQPAARYRNMTGHMTEQGPGNPAVGLGGKGSLSAAVSVQVSVLLETGALIKLTDCPLSADGTFNVALPADVQLAIADAVDASGHIVGSVLLAVDVDLDLDVALSIAPITSETSLVVRVLREALACSPCTEGGAGGAIALALDVAASVDARLVAAVCAALDLDVNVDLLIRGLAEAVVASHEARVAALLEAHVKLDVEAMVHAQLQVLIDLQKDLCRAGEGRLSPLDVAANLRVKLDAALAAAGAVDADVRVRAHVAASLALAASLTASIGVDAHLGVDLHAVLDAAVHLALCLEAQIAADAVVHLLGSAGADKVTLDAAIQAGLKLVADVNAAVNLEAAIHARIEFVDKLCGNEGTAGLLGSVTGLVGGLLGSATHTLVGTMASLSASLDAHLSANLGAVGKVVLCGAPGLDVSASVDVDLALCGLVDTLADFCGGVQTGISPELQAYGVAKLDADLLVRALATAQLVARVSL